ncbi:hypothetical protein L21_1658 [Methanoculleus chikugoensis]|uniref:Uncharacterized protein n=1 Tax=Methanoculleus chikugoensis TaxID=118126 RepID=A0A1M4MLK0_9EURY|nr:MarR family winged helix-turn-helix transcriptional regulator [Methanoculleus chikugoensis]SCL75746.1 hypothetical protein L21_1658 [Methanoculleus chikugoensis]
MTLNETQQKVLFKIGMSPGSNALSIAKELDRDQSGINKICHALRKWGLITATKKENIKKARVNELRLTALGFALVLETMSTSHLGHSDKSLPRDYHAKVMSLLSSNRDLHEGIDIFFDFYSFFTKQNNNPDYSFYMIRPMLSTVNRYLGTYKFNLRLRSTNLGGEDYDKTIQRDLYVRLFFGLWNFMHFRNPAVWLPPDSSSTDGHEDAKEYEQEIEFYRGKILPRFQKSRGWDLILEELANREAECARVNALRTWIQKN